MFLVIPMENTATIEMFKNATIQKFHYIYCYNSHMDNRYGGVIWTNHALSRLSERGIKQGDAWATFSHPQKSEYAKAKGAWIYWRDYNGFQIEVVARQNEKKQWIILSVWSKAITAAKTSANYGKLENMVEKILQKLFGRLRKNS